MKACGPWNGLLLFQHWGRYRQLADQQPALGGCWLCKNLVHAILVYCVLACAVLPVMTGTLHLTVWLYFLCVLCFSTPPSNKNKFLGCPVKDHLTMLMQNNVQTVSAWCMFQTHDIRSWSNRTTIFTDHPLNSCYRTSSFQKHTSYW